jgi:pimeloyl-ACP methyl ester carboxylesterase
MSTRSRSGLVLLLLLLQFLVAACVQPPATMNRSSKASPVPDRLVVRGGELDYRVTGSGEPVLLIHGSAFADGFDALRGEPSLADYQLITYHRRGYAGSTRATPPVSIELQAADAVALLDRLNIKRAHVVGHSYGGSIALQVAALHPQRVASITLLEPAVPALGGMDPALTGAITAATALYKQGDSRAALVRFANVIEPGAWDAMAAAGATAMQEQAIKDAGTFFDVEIPALQQWKFGSEDVGKLTMPALAVVGANSKAAARESHEALLRAMPQAEEFVAAGAGHSLQMKQPKVVADAVGVFLRKHPIR